MSDILLPAFLERLETRYNRSDYLFSDPIEFVHRYKDSSWDQEGVALISSALAYGNVKQIKKSVSDLLNRMNRISTSPADFVRKLSDPSFSLLARKTFRGWVHRFNRGDDLVELLKLLNGSWRQYGSLGAHFLTHLEPESPSIENALNRLLSDWKAALPKAVRQRPSMKFLLSSPDAGSTCKRWCMFLRWMGRKDSVDTGLWVKDDVHNAFQATFPRGRSLQPELLIFPIDTHTGRITRYIGLTRRKSPSWKMAVEVTERLKKFYPHDPVRCDFSLARLGILRFCKKKYDLNVCPGCDLLPVCGFAKGRLRKKARLKEHV